MSNLIYTAALDALRRGWSVIPVNRHKVPLVPWKPFQRELPAAELLREWFERQPNKNLGLVTGAISGRFVVETDSEAACEYLLARGLPPSPVVQSSQPYKRHFHFRHPGFPIANSTSKLFAGLDVRGDGGYVVLPPSLHQSGVRYQWLVAPDDVELPDAPDWILAAVRAFRGQMPEAGSQNGDIETAVPPGANITNQTATGSDGKYQRTCAFPTNPTGETAGGWPVGVVLQTGTSIPGPPTNSPTDAPRDELKPSPTSPPNLPPTPSWPPASDLWPLNERNYVTAAFEAELEKVAYAPDGQKHSQLFKSVASIAGFIPGGYLEATEVEQRFYDAIAGRARDPEAAWRTIRDAIRRGQENPRHLPSSMTPNVRLRGGAAHRNSQGSHPDSTTPSVTASPSTAPNVNVTEPLTSLEAVLPVEEPGLYAIEDGRTVFRVIKVVGRGGDKREVEEYAPVADLVATIQREYRHEDGRTSFGIKGRTRNHRAFQIEIEGEKMADAKVVLAALSNVADANCVFYPRRGEHLAAAIKSFSQPHEIEVIRRFQRTGWTEQGEFIIPGLAPPDVEIRLDRELAYRVVPPLPAEERFPAEERKRAGAEESGDGRSSGSVTTFPLNNSSAPQPLRSSASNRSSAVDPEDLLNLLLSAHIETVTPLALSHALLAPLSRLAGWQDEKFALFLTGRSGVFKTSWAQMLMCLYGDFADDDKLLKFGAGGTINAMMSYPASAADLPLLIDNFKPGTGNGPREATTLIHGLMEGTEKKRLNRDGSRREAREFRCWMLFTGEDTLADAASIARMLIVGAQWENDKPNPALSELQSLCHQLPRLGGSWISWLQSGDAKPAIEEAKSHLGERRGLWVKYLRRQNGEMVNALRIATSLALCECAWEVALQHEPFTATLEKWSASFERALTQCAQAMAGASASSHEANRYLATLRSLVLSQKAYLQETARDATPEERRIFLGWQDANFVYLLPEVAFNAALEALKHQNGLNGLTQHTLAKQLDQLGFLAKKDSQHLAVKKRLGSSRSRVLIIERDILRR